MRLNDEKDSEKSVLQNIEKFVQRVRMVAHAIVQGTQSSFDPDQDGYVLNDQDAYRLHKSVNILYYVRRSLLVNKAKLFEQFAAILDKYSVELPHQSWTSKHDRDLLKLVSLYGYDSDKIQAEF